MSWEKKGRKQGQGNREARPSDSRLVYGRHPVLTALKASREPPSVVWFVPPLEEELEALASSRGVVLKPVDRKELGRLSGTEQHQGVAALLPALHYLDELDLIDLVQDLLDRGVAPLVLVLDQVQDPQNLGAIIRSAHELGAHVMVLPERRSVFVTPVVTKAAAGAAELLPVAKVVNLSRTLAGLEDLGLLTVAAVGEAKQDPAELDLAGPLVLVLGSEGKGIRPLVDRHCRVRVSIPLVGHVGSLNVSVAAGILLYEVSRQRRATKG